MRSSARGAALLSVLALTVILLMMVAVLVKRGETGLYRSSRYRDGLQATQAARGGSNHLIALLTAQGNYSTAQNVSLGNSRYSFTFDTTQEFFSVNNLNNAAPSSQLSALGRTVGPYSADLLVVGQCGTQRKVAHLLVQRGLSSSGSVNAVGRVNLLGSVEVSGIKSVLPPAGQADPEPAAGGIVSKHRSASAGDPSIAWDGTGTFTLTPLSRLEAAPILSGGVPVSANLEALFPDSIIRSASADTIPQLDVTGLVTAGQTNPPLPGVGGVRSGYVYVPTDYSHGGDLTVNGNLELIGGGSLYVDGDLEVNGSVSGTGALYVSGNITVRGGDAVVSTSEPGGTALLAGGNVTLEGLDASGYLDTLAGSYGFSGDVTRLRQLLGNYTTASAPGDFWGLAADIGKHDGPFAGHNSYISPIPGPDGTHNQGFANAASVKVALAIKSLHPGYSTDLRAQKVVRALERLQYHFRHNLHTVAHNGVDFVSQSGSTTYSLTDDYQLQDSSGAVVPPSAFDFPPNAMAGDEWDDRNYPEPRHSHDHLGFGGMPFLIITIRSTSIGWGSLLFRVWSTPGVIFR